jgi:HlyD family secretion protein
LQEEVSAQLLETRQKINAAKTKLLVADDQLNRLENKAPRSGTVQGSKVFTVGQVIRAGESLMEIAPSGETLVVYAQLPVNSIEHLMVGQTAEMRFPALRSRRMLMMTGKLASISHDRLVDETTKQPYFLGLINLSDATIDERSREKPVAGMQADVVIATGERTALDYMVSPLADALHSGIDPARRSFRLLWAKYGQYELIAYLPVILRPISEVMAPFLRIQSCHRLFVSRVQIEFEWWESPSCKRRACITVPLAPINSA